jgi:hypothetical protein
MPGRLRFVRNSRDLFADEPIEQRRFSGIRTAYQCDVTAAKFRWLHSLEVSKQKEERENAVLSSK